MNAKKELLKLADGENILAISMGELGCLLDEQKHPNYFKGKQKVEEALKILDFDFDSGYGVEEGYSLYAWTKTKVIVEGTYDGAEWYESIPRNPTDEQMPKSIGG